MNRTLAAGGALGLAALVLPFGGSAHAEDPAFTGFSTVSTATPLRIEIYEPTIPIPATPQAEIEFGYSTVEADTGSSRGRASYLWPGDAVGEGFKTIIENLGLPEELSGPVGAQGYPFQVNSTSPTGEASQSDEPFPGMVMRTKATPDRTIAQTGYSTDCQVEQEQADGGGGGGDGGGTPGLPDVPILDGLLPGTSADEPATESKKSAKATSATSAKAEEPEESCKIPAELRALVDFGGYVASSTSTNTDGLVAAESRAAVTDIELLGGVVTISGVHSTSTSESNGVKGDPGGKAKYGALAINGQEFTLGPDGVEGGGQSQQIPGMPDDPAKALAQLGITITAPKPAYDIDGDKAVSSVAGLVVELDTAPLRHNLDAIPFDDLVNQVPNETGKLKSALGAAVHLAPKFVFTFGDSRTVVDTVQGIEIPTTPTTGGGGEDTSTSGSAGGGGGTSAPAAGAPAAGAPSGDSAPAADGDLTGAEPMGAGLPPLNSIPGALTLGGIAAAAAAGTWLRKIGAIALGGAGSCSHGLDSGLPDLRKA